MFLALVNASVPVKDAQRFADYYKGAYVGCWEPYSDDAGEPIFTAELITGAGGYTRPCAHQKCR